MDDPNRGTEQQNLIHFPLNFINLTSPSLHEMICLWMAIDKNMGWGGGWRLWARDSSFGVLFYHIVTLYIEISGEEDNATNITVLFEIIFLNKDGGW